jgi:hypothetical protein
MQRRTCLSCLHFNDAASDIEAALPGLASLSSAYAAVRSSDGLCGVHDRYVASRSVCDRHITRLTAASERDV